MPVCVTADRSLPANVVIRPVDVRGLVVTNVLAVPKESVRAIL